MCANRKMVVAVVALMGWCAMAGVGFADFIGVSDGNTVTATAGSVLDANNSGSQLTDGLGMSPNDPVTKSSGATIGHPNTYYWTTAPNPSESDKWVKFTFDKLVSLDEMVIWNYNHNPGVDLTARGLKDVTITYSTGSDDSGGGNSLYSGQLVKGTGVSGMLYTNDIVLGTKALDVKAVKIAYTSNWGDTGPYYGLTEVRFVGSSVPEPSTLLLAIMGVLGLLAYAWRKRK